MEFSVGNALGTTFRVWFRNFLPFTILNALLYAPLLIWGATIMRGEVTIEKAEALDRFVLIFGLSSFLIQMFLVSTVTYGVVMELRGQRASMADNLRVGISRLLPSLLVTLLWVLCVGLGFLALIIPGVILYCMLYVAVPASVIERPGIGGALSRSSHLTSGSRPGIFALILIVGVASYGVQKLLENAFLDSADPNQIMASVQTFVYATAAFEIIAGVFGAVLTAVTYAQLRFSKEGASADELARVFD